MGKKKNAMYRTVTRVAVLLPSVFCALWGLAQTSIQERLSNVLAGYDINAHKEMYNELLRYDITQFPDSTLFDYYLLAGGLNSHTYAEETGDSSMLNPASAISHLLKAKRLCEKSLGTHSQGYMITMTGLGNEYIAGGQYEEALSFFQEGIVKSMSVRSIYSDQFANLILGIAKCYERIGWFSEVPNHYYDMWDFWNKDIEPLETYSYYPLWALQQFYSRYEMYDKAIKVGDEIEKFILSKKGDNHPALCEALYSRGNILNDLGKKEEAILVYERAVSIAKANDLINSKILGLIYGNLLLAAADVGDISKCNDLLSSIKAYGESTSDSKLYTNAVYSCARHLGQADYFEEALAFVDRIPTDGLTDDELKVITGMRDSYNKSVEILSNFDNIVNSLESYKVGSPEWFNISFDIAEGYMIMGNKRESFNTLESIYQAYTANPSVQEASPFYLMSCLMNLSTQLNEHSSFLKYALLKQDYLNSLNDVPQEYFIGNINEIVVGQIRCQQVDGIDEDLRQIESYYRSHYGQISSQYAIYLHNRGRAYQLQGKYELAKKTFLESISIQNQVKGQCMGKTVRFLEEVEQQLSEI